MNSVAKLIPAAAVIMLRAAQPRGFEVLLLHRPGNGPVRHEVHGFPCCPVHKRDHAPGLLRRCRGLSGAQARRFLGAHLAPSQALGFWIAAIRTLFEEVGVLLAVKQNGAPVTADAELGGRLLELRAARRDGALDLPALMERENLFCDAARLAYFSHWRTPAEFSPGFDTRFFFAAMPEQTVPLVTSGEVVQGSWLAPDRALQLFDRGELPMAFPTFASLRALADFDDVKGLRKEFQPEFT